MRRSGFTLAELAVALLVFAVLGLSAAHLLHAAAVSATAADHRERLLWWTTAVADSLASGQLRGPGSRDLPGDAGIRWPASGPVQAVPAGEDSVWISLPVEDLSSTPAIPVR